MRKGRRIRRRRRRRGRRRRRRRRKRRRRRRIRRQDGTEPTDTFQKALLPYEKVRSQSVGTYNERIFRYFKTFTVTNDQWVMQRVNPSSPVAKKFKTQPSARKFMLIVF